jgi:hypothetical protein
MANLTLTRGTTLPDSSGKADFHALIDSATASLTNVVNADIDAAAAIADSKLATISTAGKVSGAAVTLLTSVPSGAGVLPNVNNIGGAIEIIFDGGGAAIAANTAACLVVPKAVTITGAYMFADVTTTSVVNIWVDTIANYPPTVADKITSSTPPTITAGVSVTDTTLTSWTTAVAALAVMKFNVDSNSAATKLTVVLTFNRA